METLRARPWLVGSLVVMAALVAAAVVWWLVLESTKSAQEAGVIVSLLN